MRLVNIQAAPSAANELELQDRGRRFQLARVLQITEQMLRHANDGEWGKLEELESLRRLELEECFHQHGGPTSELVAEALATLLVLNEQLVEIVRYAREKTADSHSEHSRTMSAVRAYGGETR